MTRGTSQKFGRYANIHEVKSSIYADSVKMQRMGDPRGNAFDTGAWINGGWKMNDPIPNQVGEFQKNPEPCHPNNEYKQLFLCRNDSKKLGLRAQGKN